MGYSGAGGKMIDEKNQKQKISWHCPFNPRDRGLLQSTGKGFSPYRTGLYNFSGLFLQDLYVLVSLLRLNCAH